MWNFPAAPSLERARSLLNFPVLLASTVPSTYLTHPHLEKSLVFSPNDHLRGCECWRLCRTLVRTKEIRILNTFIVKVSPRTLNRLKQATVHVFVFMYVLIC